MTLSQTMYVNQVDRIEIITDTHENGTAWRKVRFHPIDGGRSFDVTAFHPDAHEGNIPTVEVAS